MSNQAAEYYGLQNSEILGLGISEEDAQFILTQFDPQHQYESWGSVHEDESANLIISQQLVDNMRSKQQELLDDLFRGLFGKVPPTNARARHLKLRTNNAAASCIRWLVWRNRPIICSTTPLTYTRNGRVFLRWYWRPTEDAIQRIRGD